MRQIILDTETTGIDPEAGHRIIEIGCIELVERRFTNNHFHVYINPLRPVDEGAFRVHGISTEFLQDKPLFKDILNDFLNFINDAELIIHNAPFDIGFLNKELTYLNWPKEIKDYCVIFDTLAFARGKHPGQRNSLDALCKRYAVDNTGRNFHGALLDANLLAHVYLAMTGGQGSLFDKAFDEECLSIYDDKVQQPHLPVTTPILYASEEELKLHNDFMKFLTDSMESA